MRRTRIEKKIKEGNEDEEEDESRIVRNMIAMRMNS